jgi:hypothetical protein
LLLKLYSGVNIATDGTPAFEQEYLLATAAARAGRCLNGAYLHRKGQVNAHFIGRK